MKYSHNSNCKLVTTSASSTKAYNFQFCKQMLTQNCLNLDRYIFIAYELTPHALSSFKCSHTSLCEWTIVFRSRDSFKQGYFQTKHFSTKLLDILPTSPCRPWPPKNGVFPWGWHCSYLHDMCLFCRQDFTANTLWLYLPFFNQTLSVKIGKTINYIWPSPLDWHNDLQTKQGVDLRQILRGDASYKIKVLSVLFSTLYI